MKNELKFNSAVCTSIEQSQRLLDLGLKADTADMRHIFFDGDLEPCIRAMPWNAICIPCQNNFPAWSLHRLMEILDSPLIEFNVLSYNPYEEIISLISECIKNGYISKEYLKQ